MNRNIDQELLKWRDDNEHKPLILRGARQTGKTYTARTLGRSFRNCAEINFEEKPAAGVFFAGELTAQNICEKLAAFCGVPIRPGETLLFLDEIQACPNALAALRFFHEQMPGLHVVAAGSLLEFALQETPSLGVGRITSRFMYPLTFTEFLDAVGDGALLPVIDAADFSHPVDAPFHQRLCERLRIYLLLGGMPEVVRTYAETHDIARCQRIIDDLLVAFHDDFGKYRRRVPAARLNEVFRSVAAQTGTKFFCSSANRELKSTAVLNALALLVKAGLALQICHSSGRGLPLGAQQQSRKFKAMLCDIGLHQCLLGLDVPAHLTANEIALVNGGSVAELFVGLHLAAHAPAHRRPELFYWHREARGANAEVDYLIQRSDTVCPVEVKAGTRGGMKSLRLFMKERSLTCGFRVAMENFARVDDVRILPLYAVHRLYEPRFC
ncbi:MAG TPA: AAA family ATPase [bacterium]|mgnify:CR=1 FL=1|nr:AAA family ATPase [bacterium]